MRCLERNKRKFYYALFQKKEPILDNDGNETGEYRVSYFEPREYRGNISVAKGETQTEMFGINTDYDRVIVIDDMDCPIKEASIIFIDREPVVSPDGEYNNNYVVKVIAKSLNSISIAIKEVRNNAND